MATCVRCGVDVQPLGSKWASTSTGGTVCRGPGIGLPLPEHTVAAVPA